MTVTQFYLHPQIGRTLTLLWCNHPSPIGFLFHQKRSHNPLDHDNVEQLK